jgi:hypothetical protein
MCGKFRSLNVGGFPDEAQKVSTCALPDLPSTEPLAAVKITIAQAPYELRLTQREGNIMSDMTLIILVLVLVFVFGGGGGYYYYRGRRQI